MQLITQENTEFLSVEQADWASYEWDIRGAMYGVDPESVEGQHIISQIVAEAEDR